MGDAETVEVEKYDDDRVEMMLVIVTEMGCYMNEVVERTSWKFMDDVDGGTVWSEN